MGVRILIGDARERLRELPDASVNCCVTSPPYFGLRDYGVDGQMGLEATPAEYVAGMVGVFREVRRVLRDDGTLWLNLGDSYGHNKNKLLIPARVALAMQDDGWILRQDNVWFKKRPMPESVRDRSTCAHEFVFHFAKSGSYYYDSQAVRTPLAESSVSRLAQNVEDQAGSQRVPGKSNGSMKAVGGDKQRGGTDSTPRIGTPPAFRDLLLSIARTAHPLDHTPSNTSERQGGGEVVNFHAAPANIGEVQDHG